MKKDEVDRLLKSFSHLKVLIIGDVMVDSYINGNIERISPEAPVPVVRVKSREERLGGAANVALNIKSLGATPILCSVTGDDTSGKSFKQLLNQENITGKGIIYSSNRPTTVKNRVMSGHHHVVRIDEETDEDLSSEEYKLLLEKITENLADTDVIIFEDYDKGIISTKLISEVKKIASKHSIPVVADPKKKNFKGYSGISLLKPNLIELSQYINKPLNTIEEIKDSATRLREDLSCEKVMVTLADKGVFIISETDSFHLAAHYRDVSDVSGAGDTVISLVALTTALGCSSKQIAELSNLGGGIVCEYHGVVPISHKRFSEELQNVL